MPYYRRLSTTQERRQCYSEWDWETMRSERIYYRGSRSPATLLDSWDDYPVSGWRDRCWKGFRRHQYKVKNHKPKKDSSTYAHSMSKREHFHLEHRYCAWIRKRCKYCKSHNTWKEYDRLIRKRHREIIEEERKRFLRLWD